MLRLISCALAAVVVSTPAASASNPADIDVLDEECAVVRYMPNGRRVVKPALAPSGRGHDGHRSATSSVARSSVSASASGGSSVSVASSSNGRGSATSSSTSNGRTVTTTHDDDGCTIVIDDRGRRGARR